MKVISLNIYKQFIHGLNFYIIISVPSNSYIVFKTPFQKLTPHSIKPAKMRNCLFVSIVHFFKKSIIFCYCKRNFS